MEITGRRADESLKNPDLEPSPSGYFYRSSPLLLRVPTPFRRPLHQTPRPVLTSFASRRVPSSRPVPTLLGPSPSHLEAEQSLILEDWDPTHPIYPDVSLSLFSRPLPRPPMGPPPPDHKSTGVPRSYSFLSSGCRREDPVLGSKRVINSSLPEFPLGGPPSYGFNG